MNYRFRGYTKAKKRILITECFTHEHLLILPLGNIIYASKKCSVLLGSDRGNISSAFNLVSK